MNDSEATRTRGRDIAKALRLAIDFLESGTSLDYVLSGLRRTCPDAADAYDEAVRQHPRVSDPVWLLRAALNGIREVA